MILIANNEATPGFATAAGLLSSDGSGLDAVEAGIRLVEADEQVRTVGRGGWPNLLGAVELDAAIMDGGSLRSGAVGALKGYAHPISVARAVMTRLPHVFLVADGAARFAREIGAETAENLTEDSRRVWQAWFEQEVPAEARRHWKTAPLIDLCRHSIDPEVGRDTTVFLAQDASGAIAAGGSTSGWAWKYPGRLGDTPVVGAGLYADSRFGACACTGAGEMTIRSGTARAVVLYMKCGMDLGEAVDTAVEDMKALDGGLISRVTVLAIDSRGSHRAVAVNGDGSQVFWLWRGEKHEPELLAAEKRPIHQGVAQGEVGGRPPPTL